MDVKDTYTGGLVNPIYPQAYNSPANECFRFTDKANNANERMLYANYWTEQINLFGQKAIYYTNSYNLTAADNLYGEQPTQQFATPQYITLAVNLNENALMLSKYGLLSEDEVTAFIPITGFYNTFGVGAEPKSGDVFQLSEYGNDRPGGRNGKMFEITERLDEDIAQINPLAGHYVWLIKAKRFEYSFEPGIPNEAVNDQVFDDTINTTASGANKPYTNSVDVESRAIFDYSRTDYSDVYGGYY